MGLVDNQGVILVEPPIPPNLRQQDAVGHQLEGGLGPHPVLEAHLIAHQGSRLGSELLGQTGGQAARGDPAGLGVADPPGDPPPQLEAELGQLGGLAGAGLAAHHDHLVIADQRRYLLAALADGQLRGIDNRRDLGLAVLEQGLGFADGLPERNQLPVAGPALLRAPQQDTPTAAEGPPIAEKAGSELRRGWKPVGIKFCWHSTG